MTERKRTKMFSVTADDCRWTYKRGSGKGGQKRNKTSNAVQVFHDPSGAMGESEDGRSQGQNRRTAFTAMVNSDKFQSWLKFKIDAGMDRIEIDEPDESGRERIIRKLRMDEV